MKIKWNKPRRLIVFAVLLALVAEVVLYSVGVIGPEGKANSLEADNGDDRRIAAEISNITGVETERLVGMKASGRSWNDILESLKSTDGLRDNAVKEKRSLQLLGTGLGEVAAARLTALGYAQTDIVGAKLPAERIALQIKQLIEEAAPIAPVAPAPSTGLGDLSVDGKEAFMTELRSVAELFDIESAVGYMLALKPQFGSYEAVLDEYLAALQLGLKLDDYATDKAGYEKDKRQKQMERIGLAVVTAIEIERRLLDRIREQNAASMRDAAGQPTAEPSVAKPYSEGAVNPLPDVPTTKVKDVKPVNPAEAIREELRKIDPNVPAASR
jgi:hypothetical protein